MEQKRGTILMWLIYLMLLTALIDFETQQLVLQKTRMGKSRKRNHIFYVVNSKNALQISLESQSKATVRNGAKTPQIQIPAMQTIIITLWPIAFCIILFNFILFLPAVGILQSNPEKRMTEFSLITSQKII